MTVHDCSFSNRFFFLSFSTNMLPNLHVFFYCTHLTCDTLQTTRTHYTSKRFHDDKIRVLLHVSSCMSCYLIKSLVSYSVAMQLIANDECTTSHTSIFTKKSQPYDMWIISCKCNHKFMNCFRFIYAPHSIASMAFQLNQTKTKNIVLNINSINHIN